MAYRTHFERRVRLAEEPVYRAEFRKAVAKKDKTQPPRHRNAIAGGCQEKRELLGLFVVCESFLCVWLFRGVEGETSC